MLFVIDVGNTNIAMGFYDGDTLVSSYRMATEKNRSSDEIGLFFLQIFQNAGIEINRIDGVAISSVVPQIMHALENAVRKYVKVTPFVVTSQLPLGMKILLDNPAELGADRLVNAIAAYRTYGGPTIIIDFGTATTFCVVNAEGNYLGGAIYPGLKVSMDALVEKTSKLPKVEIVKPEHVIGSNTVKSMQSGIVYGYAGMVDYIVSKMKDELGAPKANVIATGGLSTLIAGEARSITHTSRNLTLIGLKMIYDDLNSKQ